MAQLVKNLPAMQETWVRSLGLRRSPGEGKGYSLQYSGLENSMDCIVHGVSKCRTRLSDFHFTFIFQLAAGKSSWSWDATTPQRCSQAILFLLPHLPVQ